MSAPQTVDWFRLLWDLIQHGNTLRIISARTGIAEATLRGYLAGSHPPHWRGEALVRIWCSTFDADRSGIAMTDVYIAPRVVERKGAPEVNDSIKELERAWR